MLACHTCDIAYLFPLYHGSPLGIAHPLNGQQEELSDEMVAAWTNLAWTGNPNGIGNSPWPRYENRPLAASKTAPAILSENIPSLSTFTDYAFSQAHHCDFWDSVAPF
jgi:para-nitrobenzyl esterase